ncbi:SNF2 family helicase [Spironucleus salmonicida]|nr:SNF2 family helicase [Spironucleus salmonicida]
MSKPNDPFSRFNNDEVLLSASLSQMEILANSRVYQKNQQENDDKFYEECLQSATKALNFSKQENLQLIEQDYFCYKESISNKQVKLNEQLINIGLDALETLAIDNLMPQLNDPFLEEQLKLIFSQIKHIIQPIYDFQAVNQQSAFALLQKLAIGETVNLILEWSSNTKEFQDLTFTTINGGNVQLSARYFEPEMFQLNIILWLQLIEQIDISQILLSSNDNLPPDYAEYFEAEFVENEQKQFCQNVEFDQLTAQNSLFILVQQIIASICWYCIKQNFIDEVHNDKHSQIFSHNNYEINLNCQQYISQTNLNYLLEIYQKQFNYDYSNLIVPKHFSCLLPESVFSLISNQGTLFQFSKLKKTYEPQLELVSTQITISRPKAKQQIKDVLDQEHDVICSNNQVIKIQEYIFDDFNRDRSYYDQIIRNLQKIAQAAKSRLVKRYRSNKNANSINAECVRSRKMYNDIEQIKKRFMNETKSSGVKRVFSNVKREKKDKSQIQQVNLQQQEAIKQKLDETEQYIKEITGQPSSTDLIPVVQENGLNIKIQSTPTLFKGVLKEYQKIGFSWLSHMYTQGLSCLLCDQMGLGKTVQIITYFLHIAETQGTFGPFLVIAPNSLLNNWIQELKRFSPDFNVWPYWGSIQQRQQIRQGWSHLVYVNQILDKYNDVNIDFLPSEIFGQKKCPLHIIVTSYSLAVSDIKHLNKVPWISVVLDEGQMIKSSETKRWRTLMNIRSQQKIILSGTPIQNTLSELWSLLHFALPTVFQSKDNFAEWFTKDIESAAQKTGPIKLNQEQLQRLQQILSPFVLRREKKDVAQQLGEKKENNILCNLTQKQRQLYQGIKQKLKYQDLFNSGSENELLNVVMQLRKIVNHPQIFERNLVQSPYILMMNQQHRTVEILDQNDLESETEQSIADSETTILTQVSYKQPKIKFETQQLNDFAELVLSQPHYDYQRDVYIEKEIRSDQNRFISFEIPQLIFQEFIEYEHDVRYQTEQVANSHFNFSCIFKNIFTIFGLNFDDVQLMVTLVDCMINNINPYTRLDLNLKYLAKLVPTQFIEYCLDTFISLKQQQDICTEHQGQQIIIKNHIDALFQVYTPKCLGFNPYLYTKAPNYWFKRQKYLFDYCDKDSFYIKAYINQQSFSQPLFCSGISQLIEESGKLNALDQLLKDLYSKNQVCLIYCQMTKMMDILEDYLTYRRYIYVRLDGSYSVAERRQVVDRFMTDNTVFIFLLSTRAGSLGLNLTRANNVIFYEQDWNPTQDLQAQDRVHRLGQTKEVQIYKLIAKGSIDEKIYERGEQKITVQNLVMQGQQRDEQGNLINPDILKKKSTKDIYMDILMDE